MSDTPWTFAEARQMCRAASAAQKQAEQSVERARTAAALAEKKYRMALASEIVRQHADEGVAWSSTGDLARGNPDVAQLKYERDIAEGVRDGMEQAVWRAIADRKDAQRFADWSQRVETATGAQDDPRLSWSRGQAA